MLIWRINQTIMDNALTLEIQKWLETPAKQHTEAELRRGATLVLMLSNNRILYDNLNRNPVQRAEDIAYQLRKYAQVRLANLTHEQVVAMQSEVAKIVTKNHLNSDKSSKEEFKKGKRADHDSLPIEIQSLYKENLNILQRMRNLHSKLELLSTTGTTCPDSDRYPFLKEMIALDKKYHANWQAYDKYDPASASKTAPAAAPSTTTPANPASNAGAPKTAAKLEKTPPAETPAEKNPADPASNAATPKTAAKAGKTSKASKAKSTKAKK